MKASNSRKGTADATEPAVAGVASQVEAGNITKETDAANVAKTVTNQEVLFTIKYM